jgi:hypothetical protein
MLQLNCIAIIRLYVRKVNLQLRFISFRSQNLRDYDPNGNVKYKRLSIRIYIYIYIYIRTVGCGCVAYVLKSCKSNNVSF